MNDSSNKCIDPEIGSRIPLEIAFPIATGRAQQPENQQQAPVFSPEVQHHLENCASCREDLSRNLALWYEKGKSAYRSRKSFEILNRAERGDRSILSKQVAAGKAFFQPYNDGSSKGLLVLLSKDYLYDPEEKDLSEFEQLR